MLFWVQLLQDALELMWPVKAWCGISVLCHYSLLSKTDCYGYFVSERGEKKLFLGRQSHFPSFLLQASTQVNLLGKEWDINCGMFPLEMLGRPPFGLGHDFLQVIMLFKPVLEDRKSNLCSSTESRNSQTWFLPRGRAASWPLLSWDLGSNQVSALRDPCILSLDNSIRWAVSYFV